MKKSREHIKRFLSTLRPASEQDEHMIRLYLHKRKVKMPAPTANPDYENLDGITYEQFESWANSDMPYFGDLIKCDKTGCIGLVVMEKWDSFTIGAILKPDGVLSFDKLTLKDETWVKPSDEERKAFQKALAIEGYDWNYVSTKLEKREIPASPQFVRLMVLGEQAGIGVFKEILPDNTLEMFCVKMGEGKISYREKINLGDADYYSFHKTYDEHRALIHSALADKGYIWNSKCHRIEKNISRAKLGKSYYSITNLLKVKSYIEKNTSYDQNRFTKGNYFLSRAVAERVRDKIQIICREEMLAEDNY